MMPHRQPSWKLMQRLFRIRHNREDYRAHYGELERILYDSLHE